MIYKQFCGKIVKTIKKIYLDFPDNKIKQKIYNRKSFPEKIKI